jgi:hypothetical protein
MIKITRQSRADGVKEEWKKQYGIGQSDRSLDHRHIEIYNKLCALPDHPGPDEIAAIIGNDSWTDCQCDECGKDYGVVIQLGQEPDYESATAKICPTCLNKAVWMANQEAANG